MKRVPYRIHKIRNMLKHILIKLTKLNTQKNIKTNRNDYIIENIIKAMKKNTQLKAL